MQKRFHLGWTRARQRPRVFGPDYQVLSPLSITGSRVGAVVIVGLGILLWVALPQTRPFFLGVLCVGAVVGLILWVRHRS
ncbi:MAG: hypothetical protein L0Z50_36775 [Verrucomicrobiales bacterium]|nr:hypothetical protein [Verrucomicrobiales bacterium]